MTVQTTKEFNLERFENTMKIQGYNYKTLGKELGMECDIKSFVGKNIPLNLLNKICDTLKVDREYLLMESDKDGLKPIKPKPEPIKKEKTGVKKYYELYPDTHIENKISKDRLTDLIRRSNWKVVLLNEFVDESCSTTYSIINSSTSVTKVALSNLSWLLRADKNYLNNVSDKVNSRYVCRQIKLDKQKYYIKQAEISKYSQSEINTISNYMKVPSYLLCEMMKKKVYATKVFVDHLVTAINKCIPLKKTEEDKIAVFIGKHQPPKKDVKTEPIKKDTVKTKEITNNTDEKLTVITEQAPVLLPVADNNKTNNIMKVINLINELDLSADDMLTLKEYCKVEAKRRKILHEIV